MLTGIPVLEEEYGFKELDDAYAALGLTRDGGDRAGFSLRSGGGGGGGGNTYALSESLCIAKAAQMQVTMYCSHFTNSNVGNMYM
jgi:hypothetical protein